MGGRARQKGGSTTRQSHGGGRLLLSPSLRLATACVLAGVATPALADPGYVALLFEHIQANQDILGLSLLVGLVMFSAVTALLHLRESRKWDETGRRLRA